VKASGKKTKLDKALEFVIPGHFGVKKMRSSAVCGSVFISHWHSQTIGQKKKKPDGERRNLSGKRLRVRLDF
jgi:hypothetical protein